MQHLWKSVDEYLQDHFIEADPILKSAVDEQNAAGMPEIQVSPTEGKFLQMLARAMGARKILEIGTLGGYSTILLARALPDDGKLITLEMNPVHADVARKSFVRARLADKIELRVGAALETLPKLKAEGHVFDFVFIDADKENNVYYVQQVLEMSRPGTMIVVDNVIRHGDIINHESTSPMTQGVRRMNEYLKSEKRVEVTALQTVGMKEYDGMAFVLVK
jgi:predicted O-methyltransferase YrrM